MNNINLLRNEERYFIRCDKWRAVCRALKEFLQEQKYSDKTVTQTVYLDTEEQEVSWDTSIKARRFLGDFSLTPKISLDDEFECESKTSLLSVKTKTPRKSMPLGQFVRHQCQNSGLRLRPYFLIEYERKHFTRPDENAMRLTMDRFVHYWYLEGFKFTALPLAAEHEIFRLELKYDPILADPKLMQRIDALLRGMDAMPVNSKKESAFDYHFALMANKFPALMPLETNLKGLEIEAKLDMNSLTPVAVFQEIKNKLSGNGLLRACPAFPQMLTCASINHYFGEKDRDPVRVAFHRDDYHMVFKNQGKLNGQNAPVLERTETETKKSVFDGKTFKREIADLKLKPLGWLDRVRKAFFLENTSTGFVYHITMDRCQSPTKQTPLCQIEIEYVGILQNKYNPDIKSGLLKEMILNDIKILEEFILQTFQKEDHTSITPSALSKYKWLTQQK